MSQRKRVALVIHSLHGGGAERVARYLIEHLDQSEFEVRVILFSTTGEDFADLGLESPPVSLDKKSRWSFPAMLVRLRRYIRESRYDAIVSFLDVTNIFVVVANLGLGHRPLVLNERSFPREHLRRKRLGWLKLRLLGWAYRRADCVVCNSAATAESLAADFGVSRDRISTIRNPVPVDRIRQLAANEVLHPFVDSDVPVVIGVGRLASEKRFDVLLRAFAELRKTKLRSVSLIVVGEGPERRSLEALAARLGIGDCCDFVGYQQNPYAWLSRAAVFVLASDYEGFPNVVLEAMACGVPVVATDCPSGPNEIISDGVNGRLVPVGDPFAMAEAIEGLLDSPDGCRRIARAGRESLDAYGLVAFADRYQALLRSNGAQ